MNRLSPGRLARALRSLAGATWLCAGEASLAPAQPPQQDFLRQFQSAPFGNPQEMLDRMFGTDAEAERLAFEGIELSAEEEQRIGNEAAEAYLDWLRRQGAPLLKRGRDVVYLQSLVGVIQPLMTNAERYASIRIIVAGSPVTDARSFPGGTLVINEGLLEFAGSEAALVGVIGHELSHLDRGHQLVRAKGQKLAEQTFSGHGDAGGAAFLTTGPMLMRLWSRPFRSEDEKEADLDGARWAYQAGYDPREMAALFVRLHERNQEQGLSLPVPGFLRSHPYEVDRHAAVTDLYEQMQADAPRHDLFVGRENLERRVAWGTDAK